MERCPVSMSPLRVATKMIARRYGPAQPAVAADRCAREIVGFLKVVGSALAAAERQAVGPPINSVPATKIWYYGYLWSVWRKSVSNQSSDFATGRVFRRANILPR